MSRLEKIYQEKRPWGMFRRFTHNEVSTVKILFVKPGVRLSDQRHRQRDEFWRVLREGIIIELEHPNGKKEVLDNLREGDEVFIEKGTWHRLGCKKEVEKEGEILEISFGYFDENDIERRSDDFGRK